jgi:Lipocalin-like domain
VRKLILAVLIAALPFSAIAADEGLVGTYELVSWTRKVLDTGEVLDAFGKNPKGFIVYGKDGRMMAIIVGNERPKAESVGKITDQQRADLFRTMLAYGGTYKFDGIKVEHHLDISWNEVWTGTTVVRDVIKDGNKVVLTTKPAPFSGDGKMSVSTLVWEKMK